MPVQPLPEFEDALAKAGGQLDAAGLSECHGAVCGMLCRHPQHDEDQYLRLLTELELAREPADEMRECLVSLHQATVSQISDEQLRFKVWLPDDEEPLEDRARALAHWCSGFLAGLGFGHDAAMDELSGDLEEVLADLQQIARAEADTDGDSEEEEAALVEVVEYIRIVTLMLREALRPPESRDRLH